MAVRSYRSNVSRIRFAIARVISLREILETPSWRSRKKMGVSATLSPWRTKLTEEDRKKA